MPLPKCLIGLEANKPGLQLAVIKQPFCDYYSLAHEQPFERKNQDDGKGGSLLRSRPIVLALIRLDR
jgi:hypothetical protein